MSDRVVIVREPRDRRVPIMMFAADLHEVDDWMFANRIRSRSEAIRRLCALGLDAASRAHGRLEVQAGDEAP